MNYKLFIIDTFCIINILDYRLNTHHLTGLEADQYAIASLHWINSLGFLPAYRDREDCNVIWAVDCKPYWRSSVFPAYKANRKPPTASYNQMSKLFYTMPFNSLGVSTFEADDIAALFCHLWANRSPDSAYSKMFICTPDSDWCGLLRTSDQLYLDLGGTAPRVRNKRVLYDWYSRKHVKQSKIRQKRYPLVDFKDFRCSDIWTWKSIVGDTSDNLPAVSKKNPDGADIRLINLYDPPAKYNLYQNESVRNRALNLLTNPKKHPDNISADNTEKIFNNLGVSPPISYIQSSELHAVANELSRA